MNIQIEKDSAPTGGNRKGRCAVTISHEDGPVSIRSVRVISRARLALIKKLLRV